MVDVETAHKSLYNVCQRFRIILDDQIFWKQYFYNLYGKKSHMVSYGMQIFFYAFFNLN